MLCLLAADKAMGPKKTIAEKKTGAAKPKAAGKDQPPQVDVVPTDVLPIDPGEKKKQQSNMITQLKHTLPSDPYYDMKMKMLEKYKSLPLRCEEKDDLLRQWFNDKTCSWVNTFQENTSYRESQSSCGVNGFGSKRLDVFISFVQVCFGFFTLTCSWEANSYLGVCLPIEP